MKLIEKLDELIISGEECTTYEFPMDCVNIDGIDFSIVREILGSDERFDEVKYQRYDLENGAISNDIEFEYSYHNFRIINHWSYKNIDEQRIIHIYDETRMEERMEKEIEEYRKKLNEAIF